MTDAGALRTAATLALTSAGLYVLTLAWGNLRQTPAEEGKTLPTVARRIVVYDTVTIRSPIAVNSRQTGHAVAKLPALPSPQADDTTGLKQVELPLADSATVVVPLSQTEYCDTLYRVWVSGYKARLDSIRVYPMRETVTLAASRGCSRWSLSVHAGWGFTPSGASPYIGIGLGWSIISW